MKSGAAIVALLQKSPMTAAQLSARMGVTTKVVWTRLNYLRKTRTDIVATREDGETRYSIARSAVSA